MSTPLRVLILEDRPADAELMVYELEQAGFEPAWQRVDTEADYLAQLQPNLDVILGDHTLPHFGAPQALELLKSRGLDIPFIVVTGSISEEVAVERIKQGAADYILKDRMARLGDAVTRSLREKKLRVEKHQAEEQTRRNLERIRALHEIDLAITSTLDLHTILGVLLEKIDLFFPSYSRSTIRLLNRETGELEPVACWNLDEADWKASLGKITAPGLNRLVTEILEKKAPLTIDNLQTDPRTADTGFWKKYNLVSCLAIPLIAKNQPIGLLSFYTREEHKFNDEEVEFLTTLAGQAAIAIHNSLLHEKTSHQARELEKANKVKSEFLSVMSHELRTPLTAVMGYTGLVKDRMFGEINQEQDKALGKVLLKSNELLDMISEILQATTIEAEAVKVVSQEVSLSHFLKTFIDDYDMPLEKDLILIWQSPSNLPTIKTDREIVKRILQNLISNAIKFTAKGSITVSARVIDGSPETADGEARSPVVGPPSFLEFKVSDTGVGIPRDKIAIIFEMFRQVDSSETRLYGGVGLGLYIVKKYTELLGGTVEVESESGKGSTFTVKIPVD